MNSTVEGKQGERGIVQEIVSTGFLDPFIDMKSFALEH